MLNVICRLKPPFLALLIIMLSAPLAHAVGGDGGTPFVIQCDGSEMIRYMYLKVGKRINGIQIECRRGAKSDDPIRTLSAGNTSVLDKAIRAAPYGIYSVRVFTGKCGAKTVRVCGLMFAIRGGPSEPNSIFQQTYGSGTRDVYDFPLLSGGINLNQVGPPLVLYGFKGRAGGEIDNLEPLFRPLSESPTRTKHVDPQALSDAINVVLGKLKVRIHNLGEFNGSSWLREDSWVKFSNVNLTRRFNLGENTRRREKGIWRAYFYANDINSQFPDLQFERNRSAFIMRMNFETQGIEIKGFCRRKKPNGEYGHCSADTSDDNPMPDVEWSNASIAFTMIPRVYDRNGVNGIVMYVQNAEIFGDFKLTGVCGTARKECKGLLGDWESQLRHAVETSVTAALNLARIMHHGLAGVDQASDLA